MIANIPFNRAYEALSELEGVDVGNCAIEGIDPKENLYYMVVKTIRGVSYIAVCGPVGDEFDVEMSLTCIKFNEKKLKKTISSWLNDYRKAIYEAKLIDIEEALNNFPSIPQRILGLETDDK